MSAVWLFLNTKSIGGSEKRFAGLWQSLAEKGNYNLVITKELYEELKTDKDVGQGLLNKRNNIKFLNYTPSNFRDMRSLYSSFIEKFAAPNDILHFIGTHPLIPGIKQKQVFSVTATSMKMYNLFGKLNHYFGSLLSNRLDVLDPKLFTDFSKWLWFKRQNILLTSNSFCNTEVFHTIDYKEKKDWLVFLGRFEKIKQVEELLSAIPSLYKEIKNVAKNDLHFYFLGNGSLESEIKATLKRPVFDAIPITVEFNSKPEEILRFSKIFFSVQLYNNYPSRSLIEAMAAGNIPVVTDIGDTRTLAKPEFSYYIPEKFQTEDVVNAVKCIYSEDQNTLEKKSKLARKVVVDEHTIESMRDYYLALYKELMIKTNGTIN